MVHAILYALNIAALLVGLWVFSLAEGEKRFSLALVQVMFCLPLLIGEYIYLATDMKGATLQLVLFSEIIFGLVWLSMAMNLHRAAITIASGSRRQLLGETVIGGMVAIAAGYFLAYHPVEYITSAKWAFGMYGPVYFSAILLLLIILYGSWRLEQFWGSLNAAQRWEYMQPEGAGQDDLEDIQINGFRIKISCTQGQGLHGVFLFGIAGDDNHLRVRFSGNDLL